MQRGIFLHDLVSLQIESKGMKASAQLYTSNRFTIDSARITTHLKMKRTMLNVWQ